mmetsp:Transcript_29024/g.68422  ORF Transcript_29024/g.68422 Transcript_29024/m.68422 type:complete len:282 (+) Transcript_29024:225-1070(+)
MASASSRIASASRARSDHRGRARREHAISHSAVSVLDRERLACLAYSPPMPSINAKYKACGWCGWGSGRGCSSGGGRLSARISAGGARPIDSSSGVAEHAAGSHIACSSSMAICCGDHWHTAAKKANSDSSAAPVASMRAASSGSTSYRPGMISLEAPTSHRAVSSLSFSRLSTSPPIIRGREAKERRVRSSRLLRRSAMVRLVGRSRSSPTVPWVSGSCSSTSTTPRCRCGCSTKSACGCASRTQPFSGTASSWIHHASPETVVAAVNGGSGDAALCCTI